MSIKSETFQSLPLWSGVTTSKNYTNGVKVLKMLMLEEARRKHPTFPEFARPNPTVKVTTANGLTKAIIDYIRLSGGQAERISCEGRVIDARKTYTDCIGRVKTIGTIKRVQTAATIGTADISATIKGRSVKIEVKIGNDRQSEAQRQYQINIERASGLYFIAKDFQTFFEWYLLTFGNNE
jgi:hypothetical protein